VSEDAALRELLDKERIAAVVTRLFVATDDRDWAAVCSCFDASVTFDMTSLAGGAPVTFSPAQIADAWRDGLRPIESVHHQIGNLRIAWARDRATAACYGIAYHCRSTKSGRNTRVFVGTYDLELRRTAPEEWRITLFRFNLRFIDGNLDLEND
jgi:3-phenylpropionate/cinnamic acid dioxygenase small subunit